MTGQGQRRRAVPPPTLSFVFQQQYDEGSTLYAGNLMT